MAVRTLKLSEVALLPAERKSQVLSDFVRVSSEANGELKELDRRIAAFERVYETTSENMQAELTSGVRKETAEICQWLMLIELQKRVSRNSR